MNINKVLSINIKSNQLVYEVGNDIIAKLNDSVIRAEVDSDNKMTLHGLKHRLVLINPDERTIQLLINSGFLQVHKMHLINAEYITLIRIKEQLIELFNDVTIPYEFEYEKNIENFLRSVNTINH
jgi:hypothetical protein